MFADELRRSAERVQRERLPEVTAAVWRAFAAGGITEAEADELSRFIGARQATPLAPARPRRSVGSRSRTPESLERRRRLCAGGWLPPVLYSRFTGAEVAALAVIARECGAVGETPCDLPIGLIAASAGVSESTVRNAVRAARAMGLLRVEERRVSATRNLPNLVSIYSPEWRSWLRRRAKGSRQGGGCKFVKGTNIDSRNRNQPSPAGTGQGAVGGERAGPAARPWLLSRSAEPPAEGGRAYASGAWRRSS